MFAILLNCDGLLNGFLGIFRNDDDLLETDRDAVVMTGAFLNGGDITGFSLI